MEKPDRKLVEVVATLLCQEAATHTNFMSALAEDMEKKSYRMEAHQRGIGGTWLVICKS